MQFFPASEFKGQALVRKGGEPGNEAMVSEDGYFWGSSPFFGLFSFFSFLFSSSIWG